MAVLCIDCKFHEEIPNSYLCRHPSNTSLVHGKMRTVTCEQMRNGTCGPNGALFRASGPRYPDLPPSPSIPEEPAVA